MFDDNKYGEYGDYGEDDYGDDGDYGDEYGDYGDEYGDYGDGYEQKEQIVDFSYKQLEQIGLPVDEDLDLPMGTQIMEKGYLRDIHQKMEIIHMDPRDRFKIEIQKILKDEHWDLDPDDKKIIKKTISKLTFIQFKNPLTYVLGYILNQILPKQVPENKILSAGLESTIKYIKKYTDEESSVSMFEVLKYARYWQTL